MKIICLFFFIFSFNFVFPQFNYLVLDSLNDIASSKGVLDKYNNFKKEGIGFEVKYNDFDLSLFIKNAKDFLGTPHSSKSSSGIDCSGLVYECLKKQNLKFARTAQDFARHGNIIIEKKKLNIGDLVFFTGTTSTSRLVSHVGIFLGDGKFIHSSSSKGVIVSSIYDKYYWGDKFIFGTRFLK